MKISRLSSGDRVLYAVVSVDNTTKEIGKQKRCRGLGFCNDESRMIAIVTWYNVTPHVTDRERNLTVLANFYSLTSTAV